MMYRLSLWERSPVILLTKTSNAESVSLWCCHGLELTTEPRGEGMWFIHTWDNKAETALIVFYHNKTVVFERDYNS